MPVRKRNEELEIKNVILFSSIERSTTVCAQFVGGFTREWSFKLPEAFKEALDIKTTVRQINKVQHSVVTQGTSYSFKKGDVIYDSILAYTFEWGEALKLTKFMIQIDDAAPDSFQIVNDSIVQSEKEGAFRLIVNRPIDGFVKFSLYRSTGSSVKIVKKIETNQKELVRFLQSGKMICKDESNVEISNLHLAEFPTASPIQSAKKRSVAS